MPFIVVSKNNTNLVIQSDIGICNSGDRAQNPIINANTGTITTNTYTCNVNKPHFAADYDFNKDLVTTSANGMYILEGSSQTNEVSADKLSVNQIDKKRFEIKLTGVKSRAGVSTIQFPTWSEINGQDDIKWYEAKKNSDGSYSYIVDISQHNSSYGKYYIHTYGINGLGERNYVNGLGFDMTSYSASDITISAKNNNVFNLSVTNVDSTSKINKVSVAVWSGKDGQDDLKWYEAVRDSANNYNFTVNIANHKYDYGIYHAHAYISTGNVVGKMLYGKAVNFEEKYKVNVKAVKNSEVAYDIFVDKDKGYEVDFDSISVAVWSGNGGQDDLKWYDASFVNGSSKLTVNINNHYSTPGRYYVHVYSKNKGKLVKFLNATTFDVEAIKTNEMSVNKTSSTSFTSKIENVSVGYTPKVVYAAIWSGDGGQDDLKWYAMNKVSTSSYKIDTSIVNHKSTRGVYYIHFYTMSSSGKLKFVGGEKIEFAKPTANLEIVSQTASKVTFRINNIVSEGGVKSLVLPVWSDVNGQDDLVWYTPKRQGDGSYLVEVNTANHRYSRGKYYAHLYVKDNYNSFILTNAISASFSTIKGDISFKNSSATTFQIKVTNLESYTGISKIYIPTWSGVNGQDDIKWYLAKRQSDGSYIANVNIANHKNNKGKYYAHVYGVDMYNNMYFITGSTITK